MNSGKTVLLIGFDASVASPLSWQEISDGLKSSEAQLAAHGHQLDICLISAEPADVSLVERALDQKPYDVVVVGGGVRLPPQNNTLFERIINIVHQRAPQAKIGFSLSPISSGDAALRVL